MDGDTQQTSGFIDIFNPAAEYRPYGPEIKEAVLSVLDSGGYILGEQVAQFEAELAAYLGVRHVVGVASGTDALLIALRASGVRRGDEVITTPFSFIATASSILRVGAKPVFADISLEDYNIDPHTVRACMSKRTKAIIPVHLYGHPAPMEDIKELANRYGLVVIEDAAQSLGAEVRGKKVGSLGHVAAFSFYPTKILGGFGDGGAIATDDHEIAEKAKALRDHGRTGKDEYSVLGYNSRLDEIQAAALRVKLRYVEQMVEKRRSVAQIYNQMLEGTSFAIPRESEGMRHVYGLYTVRCSSRERFAEFLQRNGVGYGIYYPRPIFDNSFFEKYPFFAGDCPRTRVACREVISLPMHSGLSAEEVGRVSEVLRKWSESET